MIYYIEKGVRGDPSMSQLMRPLSMHKDPEQKNQDNADRKYFARISTSESPEHCWIKVINHTAIPPVQYWSTPEERHDYIQQLVVEREFTFNLERDPSKPFVLPSNSKWEIIVDPQAHAMFVQMLDRLADLDMVENPEAGILYPDSGIRNVPYGGPVEPNQVALAEKRTLKIATGSCLQQRFKRLQAFAAMARDEPDVIVLSGDNVYLDMIPRQYGCLPCFSLVHFLSLHSVSCMEFPAFIPIALSLSLSTDNDVVDNDKCPNSCFNWFWESVDLDASVEYQRLLRHPDFPKSTDKWNPVWLAIWDDHDYGKDNSDSRNPQKYANKKAFMNFYKKLNPGRSWMQSMSMSHPRS